MPGFPAPFIKFREDDANGFPLAGGRLYSYAAGSSSPLATYTNQELTIPNANPTILDASGRASIFVQDGIGYKFVLHDAIGNMMWTVDNVQVPRVLMPAAPAEVPPGGIVAYTGIAAPPGWLLCDGASVSSATYPNLFIAIQYRFGGAGSTFMVPDLRGRFLLGKAAAGTGATLGATGGTIDHAHTGGVHTHPIASHVHSIPSHSHTVSRTWAPGTSGDIASVPDMMLTAGGPGGGHWPNQDNPTSILPAAETGAQTLATSDGGAVGTSTNNPPFLVVNYIIKT